MKRYICAIAISFIICLSYSAASDPESAKGKERIGVYDSRAVAVAFAGSEAQRKWMAPLMAEHKRAREAGDAKKVKELEAEGQKRQEWAHAQGFATAPVDDLLEHIQDQLPGIKNRFEVSVLVSKWDTEELARHAKAERVDVTMALVEAFNPDEKQRQRAIEIQKVKPASMRTAERKRE